MKHACDRTYRIVRGLIYFLIRFAHPVIRIQGRENVPDGAVVVAGNHSSFTDPIWIHIGMMTKRMPLTMAKKELFNRCLIGKLLSKFGAFPVDREGNDIQAIKTSLQCLRENNKLVIFPEGTRVRHGKASEPHKGAVMLACRAKVDILPVYITAKKKFLGPIDIVIGKPYTPKTEGGKPTPEELDKLTQEMMDMIYRMGEKR